MLERGEDALMGGLLWRNKEVNVAAAFMSISPSTSMSSGHCLSLPLSTDVGFFLLLSGSFEFLVNCLVAFDDERVVD